MAGPMARSVRVFLTGAVAAATLTGASLAALVSAAAAEQPRPAGEQKVWSNDDIELLRSIAPTFTSGVRRAEQPGGAGVAGQRYVRFKDPRWYREQLEPLRLQLDRINSDIRRLRAALKSGKSGVNAIILDQETQGISPESEVQLLQQHRRDILSRIDALEDLAQSNEVPPGELRKDRTPDERAMDAYKEDAANTPLDSVPPRTEAQWRKQFADLREQLYYAQKDLELLQREWSGHLVQYYPDPNKVLREQFSRREISELARKIREKKVEVAQIQQNIYDLEDDLRHAGGPAGWSRE